jgi:hypothetical protein
MDRTHLQRAPQPATSVATAAAGGHSPERKLQSSDAQVVKKFAASCLQAGDFMRLNDELTRHGIMQLSLFKENLGSRG